MLQQYNNHIIYGNEFKKKPWAGVHMAFLVTLRRWLDFAKLKLGFEVIILDLLDEGEY